MIEYIDGDYIRKILRPRPKDMHKGHCGHVLIIAGSKGMVGAALLAAKAALRSGAGLVKISLDEEFFPIAQIAVPEAICVDRQLSLQELNEYQAIAVGPGLGIGSDLGQENGLEQVSGLVTGREPVGKALMEMVLDTERPTVIVDADGLTLLKYLGLKNVKMSAAARNGRLIITPHPGEAAGLLDTGSKEINRDRNRYGRELSQNYGAISLLKGSETVITDLSGKQYINTSGNPGMATAGSGDVLTGVIAGFAAQGYSPLEATLTGAYIHGAAGDKGAELLGEYGLIASDIGSMVGLVIKEIMTEGK